VKTPVLLVAHRRPRETERVANAIVSANAKQVYVATDGPRQGVPSEAEQCASVYLTSNENLGARERIPSAIEWAFDEMEQLLVLEDDYLPDPTFFRFCEELLNRYRSEPKVTTISGTNPVPWRRNPSFRFST
jgi:hypothetical protein